MFGFSGLDSTECILFTNSFLLEEIGLVQYFECPDVAEN